MNGVAPRDVFEEMLKYSVFPTFDLVIQHEKGIPIVRRRIPPYKGQWALPGLRQLKGEHIDDVLLRIAKDELGLDILLDTKRIISQYDGIFTTENARQDISTGYFVKARPGQAILLNKEHFTGYRFIKSPEEIPSNIGAMYTHYLHTHFDV